MHPALEQKQEDFLNRDDATAQFLRLWQTLCRKSSFVRYMYRTVNLVDLAIIGAPPSKKISPNGAILTQ